MALKEYEVTIAGIVHTLQANSVEEAERFGTDVKLVSKTDSKTDNKK